MKVAVPDAAGMALAVSALRQGQVVAYPTDTVYGLAVDPFSPEALRRLFAVKGRDDGKPILLVISGESQLSMVTVAVSRQARQCMEAFWPGPLSLLLARHPLLPEAVTAGSDKVCVRCPDCAVARSLCDAFGGAITSTSANRSGMAPARSVEELDVPGLTVVLDGGPLADSPPSTVYDPELGVILREGAYSAAALRARGIAVR